MLQKILFSALLLLGFIYVANSQIPAGKVVSCYFESWSFYRPDNGKYDVDNIDPFLCTHGYYAFADMDNVTYEVYAMDPWYDLAPWDCQPGYCNYNSFRRFVALKEVNPNFIPMLSIGGWNSGSAKYSIMAADPDKRNTFISSVVNFLGYYGFEGVDFDWEYPGVREGADAENDKENYATLVRELSARLKENNLYFTAALGCGFDKIEVAYDMDVLSQYYDHMNIMGYDFQGAWNNFTGHNSPIYSHPEERIEGHPGYRYNIWACIEDYKYLNTPPEKMVLGLPTYGRGWILDDVANDGFFCDAHEGCPPGPYTRQAGIVGYNEVIEMKAATGTYGNYTLATPGAWVDHLDDCYDAPFMTNGPYWIGYDNPDSIAQKVKYANNENFLGIMIWSLDTDDFINGYPLLTRIRDELIAGERYDPYEPSCGNTPVCDVEFTTATASPTVPAGF